MKPKIIKADIAGYMVKFPNEDDVYYVGDSCPPIGNGYVYKDKAAFNNKVGICYVPEIDFLDEVGIDENVSDEMLHWMRIHCEWYVALDNGFTYDDLRELVEEWVGDQLDGMCTEYIRDLFVDYITERLFEELDWQCPDTLLNEWDVMELYEDAPQLSCADPRFDEQGNRKQ